MRRLQCILIILLGVLLAPANASAHPWLDLEIVGSQYVQPGDTVTFKGRFDGTTHELPASASPVTLRLGRLDGVALGQATLDARYAFTLTAVIPAATPTSRYVIVAEAVGASGEAITPDSPATAVLAVGITAPATAAPAQPETSNPRPSPGSQTQLQPDPAQRPTEAPPQAVQQRTSAPVAPVSTRGRSTTTPLRLPVAVAGAPQPRRGRKESARRGASNPRETVAVPLKRLAGVRQQLVAESAVVAPRTASSSARPTSLPTPQIAREPLGQRGVATRSATADPARPSAHGASGRAVAVLDLLVLLAALGLIAGGARWRGVERRDGGLPPQATGPDLVEAALQELLAEERARQVTAPEPASREASAVSATTPGASELTSIGASPS